MATLFHRPTDATALLVAPRLASWNRTGDTDQLRLAEYLHHVESLAESLITDADPPPLAMELVIGLPDDVPLDSGGRDLDNYLLPVTQRLGANRFAAVFARKIHQQASTLAVSSAIPRNASRRADLTTTMAGSYVLGQWKVGLREELLRGAAEPLAAGPVTVEIAIATGPGRNWSNIWKPLLDSFGPVLGENPDQSFHPNDDRITDLGLHHEIDAALGHDVRIDAWWHH
jgi:hypothetical protein